jgi:nucleoside-diphosphate-sugar epimerase
MAPESRVGVFGASGLVGSFVSAHLLARGWDVVPLSAPRGPRLSPSDGRETWVAAAQEQSEKLDLGGLDAVVNAAGHADAVSSDDDAFRWPNAVLPLCLFRACARAEVPRFVHVSSAAVQGRLRLDDSEQHQPHSAYARSKALGEDLLLAEPLGPTRLVIYRPVGVQVASRPTTRSLVRLASSRLNTVARTSQGPSPQLTVESMCTAIAYVLDHADPPMIVAHTGDGLSPYELCSLLGGRRPHRVPNVLARAAVRVAALRHAGWGRRAEVLLFGQPVASTWLGRQLPPEADAEAWRRLGREVRGG